MITHAIIPISTGKYAILDSEDYDKISSYRWTYAHGYAQAGHENTTIRMHRLILGVTDKRQPVDHINGDKLDNRKKNLRLCTWSQNRMNVGISERNKSGYKGVVERPYKNVKKRFVAFIYKDYKQYYLGYYETAEEAARKYDEEAHKLFGEFAKTNFPKEA